MKKTLFFVEKKLFNVLAYWEYWKLKRVLQYDAIKLGKYQRKQLEKTVHAAMRFNLYQEKFRQAGVDPASIHTLEDLKKIPPLTKSEYRQMVQEALDADSTGIYKNCHHDHTSGSTGMPLHICQTPREAAAVVAQLLYILNKNGYRLFRDSSLDMSSPVHKGTRKAKSVLQRFGLLRKTYVSTMDSPEHIIETINQSKPEEILAGKSILSSVLSYAKEHQYKVHPVKLVVNTAEKMDDGAMALIEEFFGSHVMIDTYASIDLGIIASTRREDRFCFHLNPAHYLYEILDEQGEEAESGRIVVTRLDQREFPMLRYNQGDWIESFRNEKTNELFFRTVNGRADDYIVTREGKRFSFHSLFAFLPRCLDLLQYRVIQEDYDHLHLLLVSKPGCVREHSEMEREFTENLDRYLTGANMKYTFEWVESIPMDPNGKIRVIISKVAQ